MKRITRPHCGHRITPQAQQGRGGAESTDREVQILIAFHARQQVVLVGRGVDLGVDADHLVEVGVGQVVKGESV